MRQDADLFCQCICPGALASSQPWQPLAVVPPSLLSFALYPSLPPAPVSSQLGAALHFREDQTPSPGTWGMGKRTEGERGTVA